MNHLICWLFLTKRAAVNVKKIAQNFVFLQSFLKELLQKLQYMSNNATLEI